LQPISSGHGRRLRNCTCLFAASCLFYAAACAESARETTVRPPAAEAPCFGSGRFRAQTWGAIETEIDWGADDMSCDGMQRPDEAGARLHFAGPVDGDSEVRKLAFILAIPQLSEGVAGRELSTRVTLIAEDEGRFFSTREAEVCWSNIEQQAAWPVDGNAGSPTYRVSGLLYCVAPIAELNGTASVTLSDVTFSGRLTWTSEP
jgi:hypothetical protein